jgi:steroid 5-alpha reductase family enzyme
VGREREPQVLRLFQFQAVFVVFFSLPFAFIALDSDSRISTLAWIGVAVWAVGNTGTIVADRQLAQWRASAANKGKTARRGLWSWSRHPHYFFEWTQ